MAYAEPNADDMVRMASSFLFKTERYLTDNDMVYYFHATPTILVDLWKHIKKCQPLASTKPTHLLWWLYYVKHYPSNKQWRLQTGIHHNTLMKNTSPIREYIMCVIPKYIKWKNRFKYDNGTTCKTYTDGTDCPINQPKKTGDGPFPWDTCWNSHKFKRAGLRYLVTSCLKTGDIVAVHGPFPCGNWPDIKIYKACLLPMLKPGEMVEADDGFPHTTVRRPGMYTCQSEKRAKKAAAGRHEAINNRIKIMKATSTMFRHDINEHKYYFYTACLVNQMMFERYGSTFDISY